MAAKVLQGRFGAKRTSLEAEILETLAVISAIERAEVYLQPRSPRRHDPTMYFLRSLLYAARWEIENAFIAKVRREDKELAFRAWASL